MGITRFFGQSRCFHGDDNLPESRLSANPFLTVVEIRTQAYERHSPGGPCQHRNLASHSRTGDKPHFHPALGRQIRARLRLADSTAGLARRTRRERRQPPTTGSGPTEQMRRQRHHDRSADSLVRELSPSGRIVPTRLSALRGTGQGCIQVAYMIGGCIQLRAMSLFPAWAGIIR